MSILHLGRRNDSAEQAGTVSEIAAVSLAPAGRLVTAVRTQAGSLRLISWQAGAGNPISRLADSGDAAGAATNIGIARAGTTSRVVTACRAGDGSLKLISWNIAASGAIARLGDSGGQAGAATVIRIAAISSTLFVTACRTGDGALRLIGWRLNANGSLSRLGDSGNAAGSVSDIALTVLPASSLGTRVTTSVRDGDGDLKVIVWSVSSAGIFQRLADSGQAAGGATLIRSALDPLGRLITSVRDGSGRLKLISWGISANGASIARLSDSGNAAGEIGANSLAGFSDGVVSAVRTAEGSLRLIAWSVNSNGSFTRRSDSGNQAGEASLIDLVPISGVGGLTMVTPLRTAANSLKLIGWGPACVRMHVKIVQQPNVPLATMVSNMVQVYGSVGIGVTLATTETLNLPATFLDIDVGTCVSGSTTAEQNQLFTNRNNVGPNDVVVYFVRSTVPPFNGCATHPAGRPGAVVAQGASQWTLAHEVGHVLGLRHVEDNLDRLMTGDGTGNITNPPPDLASSEASTMQSSPLTRPC